MRNRVLVDTNVWIEFFRPKSELGHLVENLLADNAVWMCGVVMFEVLKGIRSEEEKAKLLSIFEILPYAEMTKSLWQEASELSVSLRKRGLSFPNSDLLIAAIAFEQIFLFSPTTVISARFPV